MFLTLRERHFLNLKSAHMPVDTSCESAKIVPMCGVASDMYVCSLFSSGFIMVSCSASRTMSPPMEWPMKERRQSPKGSSSAGIFSLANCVTSKARRFAICAMLSWLCSSFECGHITYSSDSRRGIFRRVWRQT